MWVFFLKNCSFLFYQLIHELVNVLRESIIGFLSFTYQSDKVIMTVRIYCTYQKQISIGMKQYIAHICTYLVINKSRLALIMNFTFSFNVLP